MNDGQAWDFATDFSGYQAACLIIGIDPYPNAGQDDKIIPIIDRMKTSYYRGVRLLTNDALQSRSSRSLFRNQYIGALINPLKDRTPKKDQLWSIEIEGLILRYNTAYQSNWLSQSLEISSDIAENLSNEEIRQRSKEFEEKDDDDLSKREKLVAEELKNWAYEENHEFDMQKFSREELGRWINENNFRSQYDFIKSAKQISPTKSSSAVTKERNTLLLLIGVLCHTLQVGPDHNAATKILRMVEKLGLTLSDDTIREKIREAAAAIKEKQQGPVSDIVSTLNKLESSLKQ
jgi:hypothetical protein